jgi:hypothetical protein
MKQRKVTEVPVLLIAFNRSKILERNLCKLKDLQIKSIYISVDYPRKGNVNDYNEYAKIKALIKKYRKYFSLETQMLEFNSGCKVGVEVAITWFFDKVDFGVILEDDCLASATFFDFVKSKEKFLIEDKKLFNINGTCFINYTNRNKIGAYKTKYIHVWGWATNSENWSQYFNSKQYIKKSNILRWSESFWEYFVFIRTLKNCFNGRIDTWDYQLQNYLINEGLKSIAPTRNLIENIGFDGNATHTKKKPEFKIPSSPRSNKNITITNEIEDNYFRDKEIYKKSMRRLFKLNDLKIKFKS